MGLFDFFRRKPAKPPAAEGDTGDLDQPRCHHYTLAHYALRSAAFQHPLAFLGVLASPEAPQFLAEIMQSVSNHCAAREPKPDFAVADLTVQKTRVGRYPCAVVVLPRPRAMAEAFFVAAVLLADPDQDMPDPSGVALRYFTLEKGFALDGGSRTVLCEWTAEGSHVNYGDGPAPEVEAFIGAVAGLLANSP
jgi:hypothetical protein